MKSSCKLFAGGQRPEHLQGQAVRIAHRHGSVKVFLQLLVMADIVSEPAIRFAQGFYGKNRKYRDLELQDISGPFPVVGLRHFGSVVESDIFSRPGPSSRNFGDMSSLGINKTPSSDLWAITRTRLPANPTPLILHIHQSPVRGMLLLRKRYTNILLSSLPSISMHISKQWRFRL